MHKSVKETLAIYLLCLYAMFSQCSLDDVLKEISPFSFNKLCVHM